MASPKAQDRKCYGQFCPLATALDLVGDRWTMLLLRELLGGPARFSQLEDGLTGIAKNLLADRLRQLEADGVVRRVSADGATRYALTERGAAIRTALEELAFWGAQMDRVGPGRHPRSVRAIAMALQAIVGRAGERLPTEPTVIELDVEGEPVEVDLGARPRATVGPSAHADARVAVSATTIADYLDGTRLDRAGFTHVSGDRAARKALLAVLGTMMAGG